MGTLNLKKGSKTQRDGARGERMVLWYLRFRGYHLLDRNYMVGHKEIDLIMRKRNLIIFVEIKSRHNLNHGRSPIWSVNYRKQRNIISASRFYLKHKKLKNVSYRYDIAEVDLSTRKINYLPNAFSVY